MNREQLKALSSRGAGTKKVGVNKYKSYLHSCLYHILFHERGNTNKFLKKQMKWIAINFKNICDENGWSDFMTPWGMDCPLSEKIFLYFAKRSGIILEDKFYTKLSRQEVIRVLTREGLTCGDSPVSSSPIRVSGKNIFDIESTIRRYIPTPLMHDWRVNGNTQSVDLWDWGRV